MAVFRDFRGPAPAGQTRACQFGAAEIAQCAMSVKNSRAVPLRRQIR